MLHFYLSLLSRKHVFGVSDEASFKPVSSATEISYIVEISPFANLHMIRFKKRITKALIRLRGCAGWSAPLFSQTPEDRFSRVEAHLQCAEPLQMYEGIYTTKGALCAQKLGNGISYHHFFYTELFRYCPH